MHLGNVGLFILSDRGVQEELFYLFLAEWIEAFDLECVGSLKLIVHKDRRTNCPKSNKRTVIHLSSRILLHCHLCNLDILGQRDRLAKETIFNEDRQLISI